MRYLDVCSGISAPTQAWKPIGWECAGYFEIDPFACEVLATRFLSVTNYGNLLEVDHATIGERVGHVDLLVSGSPCQGFSVAGKRGGLADPRSHLLFASFALARAVGARWLVWENVPGVLSDDGGRTFKLILRTLLDLGYSASWRVLDARFFGVPQRRRRVFVVGYLGDWRPPAAVLFEPESLRRNPSESRKAGPRVARCIATGSGTSGSGYRSDGDTETLIPMLADPITTREASCYSKGGRNQGPRNVVPFDLTQITHPENRNRADPGDPSPPIVAKGRGVHVACFDDPGRFAGVHGGGEHGDLHPTLRSTNPHALVAYALGSHAGAADGDACNESHATGGAVGANVSEELAYSLRSGRTQAVAAIPISSDALRGEGVMQTPGPDADGRVRLRDPGLGIGEPGDPQFTLNASVPPAVVAFQESQSGFRETAEHPTLTENNGPRRMHGVSDGVMVRRLTSRECERLQGVSDDFTLIDRRCKPAADGPRYKALGNSMAVPVMRWIGERIAAVDTLWEGLTWKP